MSKVPYPEDEYVMALGRLVYAVSYLEWAVLGDLPHIAGIPADITLESLVGKSTGVIADSLASKKVLAQVSDPRVADWLIASANYLKEVSQLRNGILHARPATINGRQRLNRWDPKRTEIFAVQLDRLQAIIARVDDALDDINRLRLI